LPRSGSPPGLDLVRYDAFSGKEERGDDGSVQQSMLQLRHLEGRWS